MISFCKLYIQEEEVMISFCNLFLQGEEVAFEFEFANNYVDLELKTLIFIVYSLKHRTYW
jgi:hypothetical protein